MSVSVKVVTMETFVSMKRMNVSQNLAQIMHLVWMESTLILVSAKMDLTELPVKTISMNARRFLVLIMPLA